jgi:signal transduction histidine kinase
MSWSTSDYLSLVIGLLELLLAIVVFSKLARFARAFPWLVALVVFFALRGIDRIASSVSPDAASSLGLASDALVAAVLALLILQLPETVRRLSAAEDSAKWREREYARALRDYRVLIRHRLANPLTAILGSVTTLQDLHDLDEDVRSSLLDTIRREARAIEHLGLDTDTLSPEERGLSPAPKR